MQQLEMLTEDQPETLRICHGLAHEIGNANFERAESLADALAYQDDFCGSGYIHGMIETAFLEMEDVRTEMQTICTGLDTGKCYHGVGHGLMFSANNDLPFALELCDTAVSAEARARCYEGVFMENFHADDAMHPSAYRDADRPLFPCADQATQYKGACYFYAPRFYLELHENAYTDMLAVCLTAESGYQSTCTRGVGSAVAKLNIGNGELIESVCTSGSAAQLQSCIDGAVSYTMVNFDGAEEATALCGEFSTSTATLCYSSVNSKRYLFSE